MVDNFSLWTTQTHENPAGHLISLIDAVNQRLGIIRLKSGANNLQFKLDEHGHYSASMNHEYQKHHEEDAVVAILDLMEDKGYNFKFQNDQELMSVKFAGDSITKREVFVFNRAP